MDKCIYLSDDMEVLTIVKWISCNCPIITTSITCNIKNHIYPWYCSSQFKCNKCIFELQWKPIKMIQNEQEILVLRKDGKIIKLNIHNLKQININQSLSIFVKNDNSLIHYTMIPINYTINNQKLQINTDLYFDSVFKRSMCDIVIKNINGIILDNNYTNAILQFIIVWYAYGNPIFGWGTDDEGIYDLGINKYVVLFQNTCVNTIHIVNLCNIIGLKYEKTMEYLKVFCKEINSFLNVIRSQEDPMLQKKILPNIMWNINKSQLINALSLPIGYFGWNVIYSQNKTITTNKMILSNQKILLSDNNIQIHLNGNSLSEIIFEIIYRSNIEYITNGIQIICLINGLGCTLNNIKNIYELKISNEIYKKVSVVQNESCFTTTMYKFDIGEYQILTRNKNNTIVF